MNQKLYNETLQACLAGGMTDDAAHEYATDKATRNEAKAKAPKTAGELKAAGFVMTGSTTDETARKEIERDYAASGFDVEWTQLVNGTWNYYTRRQTPSHSGLRATVFDHHANVEIRFNSQNEAIISPDGKQKLLPCGTCGLLMWKKLNVVSFLCPVCCSKLSGRSRSADPSPVMKPPPPCSSG